MGETLNRTGMVSYLGRGSLSEWVCGVSLFSDEGKIWDCKRGVEHYSKQGAWGYVARE